MKRNSPGCDRTAADRKYCCPPCEYFATGIHSFTVHTSRCNAMNDASINQHHGKLFSPQPPPTGDGDPIVDLVLQDIEARVMAGEKKYGTKLKTFNGRDALVDAYQEALDLVFYLRQAIAERDAEKSTERDAGQA